MPDREPWRCPSCRAWVPPWVEAHWCGPDGGVVARLSSEPPAPPPAVMTLAPSTVTWAGGSGGSSSTVHAAGAAAGCAGTTAVTVPATVTLDGGEIMATVRREMIRYHNRGAA